MYNKQEIIRRYFSEVTDQANINNNYLMLNEGYMKAKTPINQFIEVF